MTPEKTCVMCRKSFVDRSRDGILKHCNDCYPLSKIKKVHKGGLLERGWTRTMITRFLGDHDEVGTTRNHGGVRYVHYYQMWRVREAEGLEEFQEYRKRYARRRGSGSPK